VVSGESVMINQNTITVIVSLEFLNSDEGCLNMKE